MSIDYTDIQARLRAQMESGNNKVKTSAYTGVMETYTIKVDEVSLIVDKKGNPVAILASDQVLPFRIMTITDEASKKSYQSKYQSNRQGQITEIRGMRPKVRV